MASERIGSEKDGGMGNVVGSGDLRQGHSCRDFADRRGGAKLRCVPGNDGPTRTDAVDSSAAIVARVWREPRNFVLKRAGKAAGNRGFSCGIIGMTGFA